jgi:hypothetical protein
MLAERLVRSVPVSFTRIQDKIITADNNLQKRGEVQVFGKDTEKSNCIHEKIKCILSSENTFGRSLQNLSSWQCEVEIL